MTKRKQVSGASKAQGTARAVVLYESPAARERALEFCRRIEEQPGEGLHARWFSFASLDKPEDARKASEKAGHADFVIFAVGAEGDLPGGIKLWIESWVGRRREREGTLAGLVAGERHPSATAGLKEIYLRHIAHRAGMDYVSNTPPTATKAMPDSLDSFRQRAGQMTSVLDKILRTQFHPPRL